MSADGAKSHLTSMTGFGRAEASHALGEIAVELKSVNSRFLEVKISLPPRWSALEPRLRKLLKAEVKRGKLDCRVWFRRNTEDQAAVQFNEALIQRYAEAVRRIGLKSGFEAGIPLEALLNLPGATEMPDEAIDADRYWETLAQATRGALEQFREERTREGKALAEQIEAELAVLRDRREKISAGREKVVEKYRERLAKRIAELESETKAKLEPGRLELEVALYADRGDVSEELVRLEAHLERLESLIFGAVSGPHGKELEFLLQEILREVNTTTAKLRDLEFLQTALDMKGSVERIREQVQNVE